MCFSLKIYVFALRMITQRTKHVPRTYISFIVGFYMCSRITAKENFLFIFLHNIPINNENNNGKDNNKRWRIGSIIITKKFILNFFIMCLSKIFFFMKIRFCTFYDTENPRMQKIKIPRSFQSVCFLRFF